MIDNLGVHSIRVRSAMKFLQEGWHPIKVRYNDSIGGAYLRLWWRLPSGNEEKIRPQFLKATGLWGQFTTRLKVLELFTSAPEAEPLIKKVYVPGGVALVVAIVRVVVLPVTGFWL